MLVFHCKKMNNLKKKKKIKERKKMNPKDKRFQSNYLKYYVNSTGVLTKN